MASAPPSDGNDTPGVVADTTWLLKNLSAAGNADVSFVYGADTSYVPLSGDWDGDGDDSSGLYNPATGTFFLTNANTPVPADATFIYGVGGLEPFVGDWDGDGQDTVGVRDPASGFWFLRNTNSAGPADVTFLYGLPGNRPIVGNWDGQ